MTLSDRYELRLSFFPPGTVKDIKPQVLDNQEKIKKVIESVNQTLQKKLGVRKEFVTKYSIQDPSQQAKAAGAAAAGGAGQQKAAPQVGGGVLV